MTTPERAHRTPPEVKVEGAAFDVGETRDSGWTETMGDPTWSNFLRSRAHEFGPVHPEVVAALIEAGARWDVNPRDFLNEHLADSDLTDEQVELIRPGRASVADFLFAMWIGAFAEHGVRLFVDRHENETYRVGYRLKSWSNRTGSHFDYFENLSAAVEHADRLRVKHAEKLASLALDARVASPWQRAPRHLWAG